MGWRSLRWSRWEWASSPKWAMGWLFNKAVAERPGWSHCGTSGVKVRADDGKDEIQGSLHCGGKCAASGRDDVSSLLFSLFSVGADTAAWVKRERMDSMAPLSSKKGASGAVWSGVACGCAVVRPRESWNVSWTWWVVPVKMWPCSKRRTSFT